MGLHALHRLLQLLQEPPRPLRPALPAAPAGPGTLSVLLLLSLLASGSMHALQNLPPQPLQLPPSAFAAPQLEQQGGERQRTCCCCWLLVVLLLAGPRLGLSLLVACMAAVAKGESEAVERTSERPALALLLLAPLSLANRLKTLLLLLLLCLTVNSLKNEAPAAPAASSAVGEPGRVTIGDETGVNMYSLPDIASAEECPPVLTKQKLLRPFCKQVLARLLCVPCL
jgi:hypothetical protein